MASNRDPRKDYRINRRGRKVTSSADRSKRSKKASAPKPTSSSTRSRTKGTGSKKVTNYSTPKARNARFDTAVKAELSNKAKNRKSKVTSGEGKSRTNRQKLAMLRRMLNKEKPNKVTKGDTANRGIRNLNKPSAKVTESGGKKQRIPASNNNRKTNLKLKGTWARERKLDKDFLKKMKANNIESGAFNDERLNQDSRSDAKQERAQRLQVRNKVVKGPGSRAVRKKPVTGAPRGAQGPRTAPVQGPYQKPKNIVADIPKRTNKPKAGGPPTPGVKFNPSKRRFSDNPQVKANVKALQNSPLKYIKGVTSKAGAALTIAEAGKAALTPKQGEKTKTKPTPGMSKGAVARAKSDASKTNRQSKSASFDRAFAAARKAGKKTFVWQGKKYNTKMK